MEDSGGGGADRGWGAMTTNDDGRNGNGNGRGDGIGNGATVMTLAMAQR